MEVLVTNYTNKQTVLNINWKYEFYSKIGKRYFLNFAISFEIVNYAANILSIFMYANKLYIHIVKQLEIIISNFNEFRKRYHWI